MNEFWEDDEPEVGQARGVVAWALSVDPKTGSYQGLEVPDYYVMLNESPVLIGESGARLHVDWTENAVDRLGFNYSIVLLTSGHFCFKPDFRKANVDIELVGLVRNNRGISGLVLSVAAFGASAVPAGTDNSWIGFTDSNGHSWTIVDPGNPKFWPTTAEFVEGMFFEIDQELSSGESFTPKVVNDVRVYLGGKAPLLTIKKCLVQKMSFDLAANRELSAVPETQCQLVVVNSPLAWIDGVKDNLPANVFLIGGTDDQRAHLVFLAPKTGVDLKVVLDYQTYFIKGLGTRSPEVLGGGFN